MDMPKVNECDVQECCYNQNRLCHALAITVGDSVDPCCDTFTTACSSKGGNSGSTGAVGACKVSICRYNMKLECQADGIIVGKTEHAADCLTFEPS